MERSTSGPRAATQSSPVQLIIPFSVQTHHSPQATLYVILRKAAALIFKAKPITLSGSRASFSVALRPQRPCRLLRTGSPGRPPRLSHSSGTLGQQLSASYKLSDVQSSARRAQELCENRGGHPGLPVPNSPYHICGRKTTVNQHQTHLREPVWPSGKAGKQRDLGLNPLRLSFLFKSCGLWTLSSGFVPHS